MKKTNRNFAISTVFFYTLLGSLALGNLSRVTVLPGVQVYLHDFVITLWTCFLLLKKKTLFFEILQLLRKKITTSKSLVILLLATGSVTCLHFLVHFQLIPLFYLVRLGLYGLFGLSLRKSSLPLPWKSGVTLTTVLVAVLGIIQYLFIPDTRFLFILGYDDHYNRLLSTYLDPAITGAVLLLGLIATTYSSHFTNKKVELALQAFLSLALALTMSRASYLGFFLVLILLLISKKLSFKKIAVLGVVFTITVASVLLSTKTGEGVRLTRTASVTARATATSHYLPKDIQTAIVGSGSFFQTETPATAQNSVLIPNNARIPDNFFIFLVSSFGVPLGVLLSVYWVYTLISNFKTNTFGVTTLLVLLFLSQFNALQLQPFILVFLCLVLQEEVTVKT